MKLKSIRIKNIRNIDDVHLSCGDGVHYIYGLNAQGKTSLLESIYLLSNLSSFRDGDTSAVLASGNTQGSVRGSFQIDSSTEAELRVELVKNPSRFEKRAFINQKLAKSSIEYFSLKSNQSMIPFHVVNLNPTSTDLIRMGPQVRRSFLNQVISSEEPTYLGALKRYQKSLDQKNALLKTEQRLDLDLLAVLNENLAKMGAEIIHFRLKYLSKIASPTQNFLNQIAPQQSAIFLTYKMGETLYFTGHFEVPTIQILMENLHQKIATLGHQERLRKTSLIGPHRDDLIFKVGAPSHDAPELCDVGSQGEIRSLLLALKLAELEEFEKKTKVRPVLLIDDFSSELDSARRGFLLSYLKNSELQIFVTSTDDLSKNLDSDGITIQMNHGKVVV